MKKTSLLIITILLIISCKKEREFITISKDPFISFHKDGNDLLLYFSEFDLSKDSTLNSLNNQGLELVLEDNLEKAMEKFDLALLNSPNDPIIWNNLGNLEYSNYNFDKAIECFNNALTLSDSTYLAAGLNLGRTYGLIGENGKSSVIFNIVLNKTDIPFLKGFCNLEKTRMHLNYGEIKEAKTALVKAKLALSKYSDFKSEIDILNSRIVHYFD